MAENLESLVQNVAELQRSRRERLASTLVQNPDILQPLLDASISSSGDAPEPSERAPIDLNEQLAAEMSEEEGIEVTVDLIRSHMQ